jgi:hypothetical protein
MWSGAATPPGSGADRASGTPFPAPASKWRDSDEMHCFLRGADGLDRSSSLPDAGISGP